MLKHEKMVTEEELLSRLVPLREQGKRIVFTNGCYDILHPGHVDLLARARALGDVLIMGLNDDDSVRRQNKGPDRPINTLTDRAFVLAHLASVDFVVPFGEDTPHTLIQSIQPDILVKGGDWNLDTIVGRDIVEGNGGRVYALPLLSGYSTTALIATIRERGRL